MLHGAHRRGETTSCVSARVTRQIEPASEAHRSPCKPCTCLVADRAGLFWKSGEDCQAAADNASSVRPSYNTFLFSSQGTEKRRRNCGAYLFCSTRPFLCLALLTIRCLMYLKHLGCTVKSQRKTKEEMAQSNSSGRENRYSVRLVVPLKFPEVSRRVRRRTN